MEILTKYLVSYYCYNSFIFISIKLYYYIAYAVNNSFKRLSHFLLLKN